MATDQAASSQPALCSTVGDTLNMLSRMTSAMNRLDELARRLGATPPEGLPAAAGSSGVSAPQAVNLGALIGQSNAASCDAANRLESIVSRLESQA